MCMRVRSGNLCKCDTRSIIDCFLISFHRRSFFIIVLSCIHMRACMVDVRMTRYCFCGVFLVLLVCACCLLLLFFCFLGCFFCCLFLSSCLFVVLFVCYWVGFFCFCCCFVVVVWLLLVSSFLFIFYLGGGGGVVWVFLGGRRYRAYRYLRATQTEIETTPT